MVGLGGDRAADHLHMPAVAGPRDAIFVLARGGDAALDGFGGRRHADDEGGAGRGLQFVHRLLMVVAVQHQLGAVLLQHPGESAGVA